MPKDSTSRQRLSSYVTGKWAFSLRLFPLFALFAYYPSLVLEPTFSDTSEHRLAWLQIAFFGYLSVFLVWLIFKLLIGDTEKRNIKVWHSFVISGLGGATQGLTIALLMNAYDIPDHVGLMSRMISGFVILIFWLPLSSVLAGNLYEYGQFRADALRELATLERVRLELTGLAQEIRSSVEHDLQTYLTISTLEARRQYDIEVNNISEGSTRLPGILRGTAQRDVRELVTDLMGELKTSSRKSDKGEVELQIRRRPFLSMVGVTLTGSYPFPAIVILITLTTLLPIELRNDPFDKAGKVSLILALTLSILHSISYVIWKLRKSWGPFLYFAAVGLSQMVSNGLVTHLYPEGVGLGMRRMYSTIGGYQSLTLAVVGVGILVPLCATVLISRDAARKAFEREFESEIVRQKFIDTEVSIFTRKWAQKVHGTLQSQLTAAALTIEKASSSGDMDALASAISEARILLEAPVVVESDEGAPPRSLEEEISSRCALWEALIQVTHHVNYQGATITARVQSAIGDVVEEAISNAVRHGGATSITITGAQVNSNELTLSVRDNGALIIPATRGFGSEVFDRLAGDNWSLTRDGDETVLLLRFPVSA